MANNHIIVTGYPRSGTTMFYNMLRSCVADYEFIDREYPAHLAIAMDNENRITKRPKDLFALERIHAGNKLEKSVSAIVMLRDIRSIITSRHQSVPDDYFIGFDNMYFIDTRNEIVEYTDPGLLHFYTQIRKLHSWKFLHRTVILRYEDLVVRTADIQEYLRREFGFSYTRSFSDFHENSIPDSLQTALNGLRPVDQARIEAWKDPRFSERIIDQFTRCEKLFDILIEYGYEKDRSWFDTYRD